MDMTKLRVSRGSAAGAEPTLQRRDNNKGGQHDRSTRLPIRPGALELIACFKAVR
jgi:hypothetical protein